MRQIARMHRVVVASACVLLSSVAHAQSADPRAAMEAMKRSAQLAMMPMRWLVGEWEGPASITVAPGNVMTLTQHETVRDGAFATALFIQGRGSMNAGASEHVVFEAAGLFAYDATRKQFLFMSSGGNGAAGLHESSVSGSTLTWSYVDGSGGRTRYIISRTPDDKWYEVGAVSRDDGATWTKNFEMTLVRKQ